METNEFIKLYAKLQRVAAIIKEFQCAGLRPEIAHDNLHALEIFLQFSPTDAEKEKFVKMLLGEE